MKKTLISIAAAALTFVSAQTHASGIPTVDVAALAQNIVDMGNQIQQLEQALTQVEQGVMQIDEARRQIAETQRTFDSLNGIRGLGSLLNSEIYRNARNYLPDELNRALVLGDNLSDGDYDNLRGVLRATRDAGRVFGDRSNLNMSEHSSALKELDDDELRANKANYISGKTLEAVDLRKDRLPVLIDQINMTVDQKSILDLNARINGEGVMLQNELIAVLARNEKHAAEVEAAKIAKRERMLRTSHLPYDPSEANDRARSMRAYE